MRPGGAKLNVPLESKFLHLTTSFAENSALSLGLIERQAMELSLAAEEIFMHAAHFSTPEQQLEIKARQGSYYAEFEFIFPAGGINFGACNITATISPDDQASMEQMGLLLASRLVDHFTLKPMSDGRIKFSLIKEKKYARAVRTNRTLHRPFKKWSVVRPSNQAEIMAFLELVNNDYHGFETPDFIKFPGKTADMIKSDECRVALAVSPYGLIGGGLLWKPNGGGYAECFGPYLFGQPSGSSMVEDLIDFCLNDLARTNCINLISRFSPNPLPAAYFQKLGDLDVLDKHRKWVARETFFRLLHEDIGTAVWCHPALSDFLDKEYYRLSLPREVQLIPGTVSAESPCSVITSERNLAEHYVNLTPALSGQDMEHNIGAHINLFKQEGVKMIFIGIDLGRPAHSDFVPALLHLGFSPRLIMPYAGKKDIVVFQLDPNRI